MVNTKQTSTETLSDGEVKDCDRIKKHMGKNKADRARAAQESDIKIGDKVLLRNLIHLNKLNRNFDKTVFDVCDISGSEVTSKRNISHLKKLHLLETSPSSTVLPNSEQRNPATNQEDVHNSEQVVIVLNE